MYEALTTMLDAIAKAKTAYDVADQCGIVDKVKDTHRDWSQKKKAEAEAEAERQRLWKLVFSLVEQKHLNQALALLNELSVKFPHNKALCCYVSASCYIDLHNYNKALSECDAALEASPDKDLLQKINILNAQIETELAKVNFSFSFWIQWLLATAIFGAISLLGVIGFVGEQVDSSTAGLFGILSAGISIGLAQWFLTRLRSNVGLGSLIINISIVLASLILAMMLSTTNVWLGLLSFFGCNILFTKFSTNRLINQSA